MTVGVERPRRQIPTGQHRVVRIHPDDNVAVAVDALDVGDKFVVEWKRTAKGAAGRVFKASTLLMTRSWMKS